MRMGTEQPLLILVSGLPGTGKTSIARRIADRFQVPLLNKDSIKETMFDQLGVGNRSWSKKLSQASFAILFKVVEAVLTAGASMVVEGNFPAGFTKEAIANLKNRVSFSILEVQCVTAREVLLSRYRARLAGQNRHPGHLDGQVYLELQESLGREDQGAKTLGGRTLTLDTSNFDEVALNDIFSAIRLEIPSMKMQE